VSPGPRLGVRFSQRAKQTALAALTVASAMAFTQIFSAGPRHAGAQAVRVEPTPLSPFPPASANPSAARQAGLAQPATPPVFAAATTAGSGSSAASSDDNNASTLDLAEGLQARFDAVSRSVAPSVVAISVAIESRGDDDTVRSDDMTGRKLLNLLDRTTRTVGTGFFISESGLVVTNEHVVSEAEQLWCTTDDGRVLPAYVVASDPRQDLAVLRVAQPEGAPPFKPVTFADLSTVHRGIWSIALGNPYGLSSEGRLSMSVGIVSAMGRSLPRLSSRENRLYCDLIQTTAEINPGNSGGPLFDLQGRVFGINTAVVLPQKNTNGIAFALPVTATLLGRIRELAQGKEIIYGEIGIAVSQPTARQLRSAGVSTPAPSGVRIDDVEPSGPAATALQEGDLLLAINDTPIASLDCFTANAALIRAGQHIRLTLVRDGKQMTSTVTARRRPSPATPVCRENQRYRWNGMLLGPIPTHWDFAGKPAPTSGVMVLATDSINNPYPPGTVIQAVAGKPIHTIADLQNALATTAPDRTAITTWSPPSVATTAGARTVSSTSR
jgi:serine protease Do